MEAGTRVTKVTACVMARGNSIIRRVVSTMENGRIIICMDMVNCITRIIRLRTRVNGLSISSMAKGRCTMTSQPQFSDTSITQTSRIWIRNGNIMKAISCAIPSKDKVSWCYPMMSFMRASLGMIRWMVRAGL